MEVQRVKIDAAVLLADVVGSTPLYESAGDDIALGQIAEWRERLCALVRSNSGEFISSKGDDVLSIFSDAAGAFRTASQMRAQRRLPISFHAGLHYGPIIRVGNDIYGDAVNMTARLASIANPGEVIMSQSFVDLLATDERQSLTSLDKMTFKGKSQPCNIYTFLDEDQAVNTQISIGGRASEMREVATCAVYVTLRYNGQTMCCGDNESLSIGRSPDCDLVINRPMGIAASRDDRRCKRQGPARRAKLIRHFPINAPRPRNVGAPRGRSSAGIRYHLAWHAMHKQRCASYLL